MIEDFAAEDWRPPPERWARTRRAVLAVAEAACWIYNAVTDAWRSLNPRKDNR